MKVSKLIEFLERYKNPNAEVLIQRYGFDLGDITLVGNHELKVKGTKEIDVIPLYEHMSEKAILILTR